MVRPFQRLSDEAVQVGNHLIESGQLKADAGLAVYMRDWLDGLDVHQAAAMRGVSKATVRYYRSILGRLLKTHLSGKLYTRLPKPPASPRGIRTSELAERMGVTIDHLQWLVKREEMRAQPGDEPLLPLPAKPNGRYRWTAAQAAAWIAYAKSRELAMSTTEVATLLGWPVGRLHGFLEGRKALYAIRYDEWHRGDVERLIDALAVAGALAPEEAQAARGRLQGQGEGKDV